MSDPTTTTVEPTTTTSTTTTSTTPPPSTTSTTTVEPTTTISPSPPSPPILQQFPASIFLPLDAKFFGLIDPKKIYNSNYDITWSFQYEIGGEDKEHGFCTFLTTTPNLTSAIPGHYMGFLGDAEYLLDENGNFTIGEDGNRILLESSPLTAIDHSGVLSIAFDTTGLFALSSDTFPGVGLSDIRNNSLIIRDNNNKVVFNESLSSIDSSFEMSSNKILRFRYSNTNKITIDYRFSNDSEYRTLLSTPLEFYPDAYTDLYVGVTFCSPVSSFNSPSTFNIKNLHSQGNSQSPDYDHNDFIPIHKPKNLTYTSMGSVTANPLKL